MSRFDKTYIVMTQHVSQDESEWTQQCTLQTPDDADQKYWHFCRQDFYREVRILVLDKSFRKQPDGGVIGQ